MSLNWVTGGGSGGGTRPASSGGEVLKTGYIKKAKTMKKKFFVLRAECGDHPSCLEYYDSEKKWKAHQPPKRVITLQSCFNINRRNDLKQRYVVALYTKDDCFGLALDSEEEAQQWLDALLETQRGEDTTEGERPKPAFEHVWQVQVQKKGLGSSRNILGSYMLCLTSHSLTLVRNGSVVTQQGTPVNASASEILSDSVEFSLNTIRRCGHSDCFFYMEVGRSSVTGAGELWMQTEDTNIAQNMHDAILHAMMSCRNSSVQKADRGGDADLGPHPRARSSSANEASKPVSVLQRGSSARYGTQSTNQSQHGFNVSSPGSISAPPQSAGWRPQALPHPHPTQHSSSGLPQRLGGWVGAGAQQRGQQSGIHHHHHHHHYQHHQQQHHNQQAGTTAAAISPSQRRHSVSGMGSRERCDSLPSRARTISEGPPSSSLPSSSSHHHHHPSPPSVAHSPSSSHPHHTHAAHSHHAHAHHHIHHLHHGPSPIINPSVGSAVIIRGAHLVPVSSSARPHSMYSRAGLSYSPPIISSPVSPASGACSTTDSAGSSLSMEEGEGWGGSNGGILAALPDGMAGDMGGGAYSTAHGLRYGHSLTPDEPAIMEENVDEEYMPWVPGGTTGLEMEEEEEEYGGGCDAEDEGEGEEERGDVSDVDGQGGKTKRWRLKRGNGGSLKAPSGDQHPGVYVPMGVPSSRPPPAAKSSLPSPPPHASMASSPPTTLQQPTYVASTPGSLSLPLQSVVSLGRPCQSGHVVKGQQQQVIRASASSPTSQHGAYMEMHSPCGTSSFDSVDGYMPMSPVGGGGGGPLFPTAEGSCSGGATRGPSQTAKQEDGYVPMTPGRPTDDGYVDMEPHQNKEDGGMSITGQGDMSPAASNCSVTSGTPSTDTRFSEYHLEKVSAYFTPSEEEEDGGSRGGGEGGSSTGGDDILPIGRPMRAYSVGSKPETLRRKNCLPVPNDRTNFHKSPSTSSTLEVGNMDAVRVRAFSVGSRQYLALSSANGGGSSSSPSHHHSPHRHQLHHAKAFAPSSAVGGGGSSVRSRGGALSPKGIPMATSSAHGTKKGSKSSSAPVLQMLSNSWSGSSTLCSPPGSVPSPYSQPSGSALTKQGHVTHSNHNTNNPDHDLMELDFSGRGESTGGGSSRHKDEGGGGTEEESPYVPMGVPPPSGPCHQATAPLRPTATQDSTPSSFSPPPLLLSPPSGGGKAPSTASSTSSSATLEEYVDMNYSKKGEEGLPVVLRSGGNATGSGDPNMGYMEMYPGRKSSIAMSDNHPGDYVNMEAGSAERSRGKGSSVPEASRPIAIRKERREEGNVGGGGKEQGGGRGSSPNFSLAGLLSRKSSSGTPPKGPFLDGSGGGGSPFASLRRSQRKKRAEEDEEVDGQGKEAAGDLATPTAIFPFSLNSPGSPVRPFPGQYESASKCPVDATSGTVHISYPFVPSSPVVTAGSALPGRAKGVDTLRKGEYSLSSGVNGSRGQATERVPSQLGSAVTTEGSATQFGSPEYTNCTTSPSGSCIKASDDYMPMAPLGRVRKESVVSGPMNLNAQSSLTPPSFLFSSLSPSSKLTSSPQPKGSSDYMCMKAVPAYGGSVSLTSQRTTTPMAASQRTKSSSADYMEIKLGSEPPTSPMPPTSGRNVINKNMDDYVEIDLSQKPGIIVPQASSSASQHQPSGSRTPKAISSSVGAYVPSHTGFGFLPHIPSPSSRLPPMPSSSSYTWPRKGAQEARKAAAMETASSSQGRSTMDQSKPLRDQKTDDYVQMDLGAKSSSSSVPMTEKSGGEEGNHPVSRRMSSGMSAVRVSTPPPSTTATITATTTTLITSPRSQTKTTLVSSSSATSPPTPTSERIPISTLPPSYKFALTSSSFGSKKLLPQLSSSTVPSSVPICTPQSTASTSAIVTTSTSSLTTTVDISKEKTPSAAEAVSEVPKLEPSVSAPTMSPSSISVVSMPLTTTTPTAVSSTTCCSTSVVSSCVSSASSYCAPAASTLIPTTSPTSISSLVTKPIVSSTCSILTSSPSSSVTTVVSVVGQSLPPTTSSPSSSPPAVVVATSRGASPLAVSGPIAIPTRTSAKSQVHSLLPSGPPTHFAECTTTSAICRVVTSSGGAIERAKVSKRDEEQGSPTCAASTSTVSKEKQATLPKAAVVQVSSQVPCCALPAPSMLRRVSSGGSGKGQELRSNISSKAAAKDKESGPSVVAATESSVPSPGGKESPEAASVAGGRLSECNERAEGAPEALSKPSKRRGGCRRHSGDKELGMEGVRSSRPRRRSSDVSKEGSGGSKLNRTGSGRGSRGLLSDAEDKSGSYEKLLAPGTRNQQQHHRKWGTHKSLGERAPSIGWGPLRRQMSSPSAVPDPDGAYEKLLPTNGGPSRRRSGDKSGLLPVDISYTPYSPTPVFSASSSSASSSSSLASVASSILLAPITSTLKSGGSTASSPPPPPTTTAATATTTATTAMAAPQQQQQSSPSPLGEIHYASLDLAPPTGGTANSNNNDNDNERGGRRSPRVFARSSGAESPSGGAAVALEQPLHYAEIDFSKSIASATVKNRVRH
ncbi:serine-rich adhesin for platelets [Hetaerina americana]|uniref:serine-rich adhesin for platelets n=1 Tax=Hetaerina americana TaxID=62018 RepID=UPI003A7F3158